MASSQQDCFIRGRQHTLDTSLKPDFHIKLREDSLPAHKELLISTSHYFCCLFNSGMQEARSQILNLENLNPKVVKAVVAYMYGEDIIVEWEEVTDYLDITECWLIPELKDKLEGYVEGNFDLDNCISVSLLARRYHMMNVQTQVNDFISSNFARVAAQADFLSLDLAVLKDFLTNDIMLNVSSDDILRACINWILVGEADRKKHYKDLLDHTGLMKCSHRFLKLVVQSYVKKLKDEEYPSVETYTSMLLAWTRAYGMDKKQKMVILGDTIELPSNKNVLQFDFDKSVISEMCSLPDIFVKSSQTHCSTPYGIFSCGLGSSSVACAVLDVPSMAYLCLPDQPEAGSRAFRASAVFTEDKVYVLWGSSTENIMGRLDMKTLKWSNCAPMPQASMHPIVSCSIGSMIYAFVQSKLFTYFTTWNFWHIEIGVPCRSLRSYVMSAVPVGAYIHLMITGDGREQCVRYDTTSKQWTNLSSFKNRCVPYTAVHMDKKIIVCGYYFARIDVYDTEHREWTESTLKMPCNMTNIFAMVV